MRPETVASRESIGEVHAAVFVVGAFAGDGQPELAPEARTADASIDGGLMEHLRGSGFKAKQGELALVPTLGKLRADVVAVVGLGGRDDANDQSLRRAAGSAGRRLRDKAVIASALHLALDSPHALAASVEGLLLGAYRFEKYRTQRDGAGLERLVVVGGAAEDEVRAATAMVDATYIARDLTNEPGSSLTPTDLADRAREIANASGLECTIADEKAMSERGFGGILGVARGSSEPPRLIELRYSPSSPAASIALVGKGITFDSGGLSLKDARNMETMKTDMAGAAAVLGAMSVLQELGTTVAVRAYVPATENMPGAGAIKPGDVITHYGGRTSEVTNTDAEGRLILADTVAFASEHEPDAIIDVATLTGAIDVALGKKAMGLFSNRDDLADELVAASQRAGERAWRMPLYDDYLKNLESEVADIKNSGPRSGGAINAALFIKHFLAADVPWAHLDIAGAARADSDSDETPKGATGAAARTLLAFLQHRGR